MCDNMIDKSIKGIDCETIGAKIQNMTTVLAQIVNATEKNFTEYAVSDLERAVCKAEIDSQILDTQLNVWTAPMGISE